MEENLTNEGLRVLSLCGGVETGLYALQKLSIPVKEYHTYEILPEAIAVSQYHFPFVVHHGDLYEADFEQFKGFDLLLSGSSGGYQEKKVLNHGRPRKLTPIEYERLQGLPDGYTDVTIDGKRINDTKRYSLMGNGWNEPTVEWILSGLKV